MDNLSEENKEHYNSVTTNNCALRENNYIAGHMMDRCPASMPFNVSRTSVASCKECIDNIDCVLLTKGQKTKCNTNNMCMA